jgi:hypothetical protein
VKEDVQPTSRRTAQNLVTLPVLGFMGWGAFRSYNTYGADVMSGANTTKANGSERVKGVLPKGKIGKHEISRLVMGGISSEVGRIPRSDLCSILFKTIIPKKAYETLMLCEQAGINTINIGFPSNPLIRNIRS